MNDQIEKAVEVLNKGGIVVFPTDTAFGIGCRIDKKESVEKLFEIRKRPLSQATPVLVDSVEMARKYAHIPDDVMEKYISPFWPGALTIVLECTKETVPSLVTGGTNTIGLRMPNNKTILEIIKKVGVPVLGPSANFHSEDTPFRFEDLNKELLKLVDFVVNGEVILKQASTVIDCSKKPYRILRKGAININI